MTLAWLGAIASLVVVTSAGAQPAPNCRAIQDSAKRLECFDGVVKAGQPLAWKGVGATTTRPFTVTTGWELRWKGTGLLQATLFDAAGKYVGVVANQAEPGEGSAYSPKPGTYYIKFNNIGAWSAEVVPVP